MIITFLGTRICFLITYLFFARIILRMMESVPAIPSEVNRPSPRIVSSTDALTTPLVAGIVIPQGHVNGLDHRLHRS